jgi:hypothetical protein
LITLPSVSGLSVTLVVDSRGLIALILGLKLPWESVAVLMDKNVVLDVLLCPHAAIATERVNTATKGPRTMQPMSCAEPTCYRRTMTSMTL